MWSEAVRGQIGDDRPRPRNNVGVPSVRQGSNTTPAGRQPTSMTERVEPGNVSTPAGPPRRRRPARWIALVLVAIVLAGAIMAAGAVYTNAFGAGDRFAHLLERIDLIVDPPPDRPTAPTILATPRPIAQATPEPTPPPRPAATPPGPGYGVDPTPTPSPTPTPTPKKKPVTVRVVKKPKSVFITQLTKEWCAPA